MEQPFSTSKVTVEYFDPYGVYKLVAPGLVPRLPLRHLHWQSHAGPYRSIETLHVELVPHGAEPSSVTSPSSTPTTQSRSDSVTGRDDGFQTAAIGGRGGSTENVDATTSTSRVPGKERRHQIPGLRQTPYLKILFVRCDDNDTYKSQTRSEIREWIKQHTTQVQSTKKTNTAENHDAFEWMIVHVVVPNTAAASQPRITGDGSSTDVTTKSTSRWGKSSSTLLEKLKSDFNGSAKGTPDRVAQIRIGVNDVPYSILPRVVPAVPSGYSETEKDAENAWADLIDKFKTLILSSFDLRVSQYEEDIREKDAQRSLPGWNFCTFFILKEGLARGFESVGLVDDALVGYDELSVGLDTIIKEQAVAGSAEAHGGALLAYTDDLKKIAQKALSAISTGHMEFEDEEPVDLQSKDAGSQGNPFEDIPISATKKPYRDLILANNVSVFDFRCYIFARQISLLLRQANAWSSREELLAKLKEQQDLVLRGVAPRALPPKPSDETENLVVLAEICRRTLEFIPAVSQVMRKDVIAAMTEKKKASDAEAGTHVEAALDPVLTEVVDNVVASYAFSIAQQILAQTSTKALPIPPSTLATPDGHEPKAAIPEPKTMIHPARSSSLHTRPGVRPPPPPSPGIFPGPGSMAGSPGADGPNAPFLKTGLEELASRRAELYTLCRNILEESGKKRGWSDGWSSAPILGESGMEDMEDISLDEDDDPQRAAVAVDASPEATNHFVAGFDNQLLKTALDNKDDFYRLYETLTEKALRHYTVAGHTHSMQATMADLAVLKFHLKDYATAASYFWQATPFFGESGWNLLELSMLVMYSKCLKELQRKDDYVRVVLKLLSKAASAEKDRIEHQCSLRVRAKGSRGLANNSTIQGFLAELLDVTKEVSAEVRIPLANFFCDVEVDGAPTYADNEDSFSITVKMRSLLVEELPIDGAKARIVSITGGQHRDIWLQSKGALSLKPGKGEIELFSNAIIPEIYEVDQIRLASNNLVLHYEREANQPVDRSSSILRNPRVTLYQRAGALDVRLAATRHIQLDKNNCLDLELITGWNSITSCELRIRAGTGGLRIITSETKVVESSYQLSKPAEGGVLTFKAIPSGASVKIRFPFTVEQEVLSVALKVEVSYTTEQGTFIFSKTPSVNIALPLGVNVQDVFKHKALFSRFTVSTASASPLRLFKSELLESDVFASQFGIPPSNQVMIFPKQPASLLYKIVRKSGVKVEPKSQKTMYLRLFYSVLQDEIDTVIEESLLAAAQDTPAAQFSRPIISNVLRHIQSTLSPYDLERIALLGEISTAFLSNVKWERQFMGLGRTSRGEDVAQYLGSFIAEWQKKRPKITLQGMDSTVQEPRSILIPVDIPSITIVHTADIRFHEPVPSLLGGAPDPESSDERIVSINQLLPATLHLKWTRMWDTGDSDSASPKPAAADLEFSFEVTAPADTWLVGGRRKGHFVIPAPEPGSDGGMSSTPDTEAEIPLVLIPLREGWLPYPSVEIREVAAGDVEGPGSGRGGGHGHGHCETDYRNLGETVRVVADRTRVTLSLDASGPGGGPLVLESERYVLEGRVVV